VAVQVAQPMALTVLVLMVVLAAVALVVLEQTRKAQEHLGKVMTVELEMETLITVVAVAVVQVLLVQTPLESKAVMAATV
jgi:putative copper export protein